MSGMPEHKPLAEVIDQLEHNAFYVVHSETVEDDNPAWRVAWWDDDDQIFYDTNGDRVYMNVQVIPHPLPSMS